MGGLTLNKIFGALLAVALAVMGLRELSYQLFSPPSPHYDDHGGEEKTLNEKIAENYAYYVAMSDSGGAPVVEEVFDLGLALAAADPARGERSFQQKCAICHTIEQGGANGTGPALWNSVGVPKASHAGFNYSGALAGMGGEWTYQNMNDWLYNPAAYVRGTSMAFAGLRRDDERANVIAYLAQMSENAPAFPEPIPAAADGETLEDASIEEMEAIEVAPEAEIIEAIEAGGDVGNGLAEDAADTAGDLVEEVTDTAADLVEEATDTAEDIVEEVTDAVEDATPEE